MERKKKEKMNPGPTPLNFATYLDHCLDTKQIAKTCGCILQQYLDNVTLDLSDGFSPKVFMHFVFTKQS